MAPGDLPEIRVELPVEVTTEDVMLEIPTVAREGMVVNMLPSGAWPSVDDSEGISHTEASGSGMNSLTVPVPT